MATPMTVAEILSGLKKWQIKYGAYKSWSTHNRNHKGPWGPVNGVLIHHTGSDNKDQRELLYSGIQGLPGPLCHFGIAQDGTVWLVGHGRANHAGLGDDDVLRAIINEDYNVSPPVDNEANTDGNTHLYGIEVWYSGSHTMTDAQYFSLMKLCAMICDHHGWTHKSCFGHGEWQPGKWDPGYKLGTMMNMGNVRNDIKETKARGPKPVTAPTPDNPPRDAHEVVIKSQNYREVWDTDAALPPAGTETLENPRWAPITVIRRAAEEAAQARKNTEKIMKHLGIE